MAEDKNIVVVQSRDIQNMIYSVRGKHVMLDSDLAELYKVTTGRLNEQVKRNLNRFTSQFMFQLTDDEYKSLISQNAISRIKCTLANWTGLAFKIPRSHLDSCRDWQDSKAIPKAIKEIRENCIKHNEIVDGRRSLWKNYLIMISDKTKI